MFSSCLFFPIPILDATHLSGNIRLFWSPRFEQQIFVSDSTILERYLSSTICFSDRVTSTITPPGFKSGGRPQLAEQTANFAPSDTRFWCCVASLFHHFMFCLGSFDGLGLEDPDGWLNCHDLHTVPYHFTSSFLMHCRSNSRRQAFTQTHFRVGSQVSNSDIGFWPQVEPISCTFTPDPWDKRCRLGEAKNPGPNHYPTDFFIPKDAFRIGIINPSGMYQKSELITSFGAGVWAIAETKATSKLQHVLRKEFKRLEFNAGFSTPVPQCSHTRHDAFRGISSGVACITSFPIRSVNDNHPEHIIQSHRFLTTHVSIGPHVTLLVVTIYAPPPNNQTMDDPVALTGDLVNHAVQTISEWKGPAVLVGDFNQDVTGFQSIQRLLQRGWKDAQELSVQVHGHPKSPTCITSMGTSCHSKIFCSPELASCLYHCNTCEDHLFANHPTLVMSCNMRHFAQPIVEWHLPKPFKCNNFDQDEMQRIEPDVNSSYQCDFKTALENHDVEKAASTWIKQTEQILAAGARDLNGCPIQFTSNHFGRCKGPTLKHRPKTQPVVHCARVNDFTPRTIQGPVWFRQHLRQSRRLQTLVHLIKARDRCPSPDNTSTCDRLWNSIVTAPGFPRGFPKWMVNKLGVVFPLAIPDVTTCTHLSNCFLKYFKNCDLKFQQELRAQRQQFFDEDWNKGGSLTFAGIREETFAPPCYVAKTLTHVVTRVRWSKQGLLKIFCRDTEAIVVNHPVTFQGQTVNVISKLPNAFIVDKPLFLRNQNFQATQHVYIFDKFEAGKEVIDTWNGFLQRDKDNICDTWSNAETLAAGIPQQSEISIPDFNIELWHRVQSSTPTRSARGACGFSVQEMRALPKWCLLHLFHLFHLIESRAVWPKYWLYAFTVMLPKTSTPGSPLDLRPITILSRVYRMWSRYKSVALLVGLSNNIPNVIAGGTRGMSALTLSAHFQELLEGELQDTETNGITIDIVKCYNLIPRYPLALFMAKLGWPLYLIRTYMSALMGLRRSFLVLNSVSDWQQSYTGVPEGCALAVAAMLTLSSALYYHLKVKSPETSLFTFADNWALKFLQAAHAPMGIIALEEFCQSLKLRISVPKSWLWTLNEHTAHKVEGLRLQGTVIPVVKHTKDLGVDINYRGRYKRDFQKKRLSLGLQRCHKVTQRNQPKKVASRLLLSSCFPKAAYGVEIQMPTIKEFCSFRTSAARSLGLARKGSSPYIALNLLDKNHDFEYYAQIRTIMFWRQYIKLFPARKPFVFQKLMTPSNKGPVSTLANLISSWGNIMADGFFHSCFFGKVSWVLCSKKFLTHVIHTHWINKTCQYLTKLPRKYFECEFTDVNGITQVLRKMDSTEQQVIRTHCSGTNYTNNVQCKYRDIPNQCPFCTCPDSRQHRILHCVGLQQERNKLSGNALQLLQQHSVLSHFALMPIGEPYLSIRLQLNSDIVVPAWAPYTNNTVSVHVFTDGSCFHNTERQLALAGAAIAVFDHVGQSKPIKTHRQMIPGSDHSSFRSEVYAILVAVSAYKHLIIYTDCEAALQGLVYILDCLERDIAPTFFDHADLWNIMYNTIKRHQTSVSVIKVKAHSEHLFHSTPFDQWCSQSNAFVDKEAKQSILIDNSDIFQAFHNQH